MIADDEVGSVDLAANASRHAISACCSACTAVAYIDASDRAMLKNQGLNDEAVTACTFLVEDAENLTNAADELLRRARQLLAVRIAIQESPRAEDA
jgi:hypothetical protein